MELLVSSDTWPRYGKGVVQKGKESLKLLGELLVNETKALAFAALLSSH